MHPQSTRDVVRTVEPVPRDWWTREHWTKPECAAELGVGRERIERTISVIQKQLTDEWFDDQDAKIEGRHELANALYWPMRSAMLRVIYWADLISAAEQCPDGAGKIRELLWSPNYEDFVAEVAVLRLLIEQGRSARLVATDATCRTPDIAVNDDPRFEIEVATLDTLRNVSRRRAFIDYVALLILPLWSGYDVSISVAPEFIASLDDVHATQKIRDGAVNWSRFGGHLGRG